MKFIRYALALSLVTCGGIFAATTTKPAKNAKYKKIESKKQTPAKYTTAKKSTAKDRYGKTSGRYKKMEMKKHEKGLRKPATKPLAVKSTTLDRPQQAATPSTAATPATNPAESTASKVAGWLGLGATGAAATSAIATHHKAGYHTGPRAEKWNHHFGPGAKGFEEGTNEYGHWVFAGYRPDWWKTNYPIYWKDVVGPLYRKTAEYQKTLGK